MDLGLDGKTVLITGGSKGIGLATAHAFAAEGCRLHLVARTQADLDAAQGALQSEHGAEVTVHALDLSRGENVKALAAACPEVDVLVNNAGAIPAGDVAAIDEERWREAWDLKVFGYINMTREYEALMRARGHGVIVNIVGTAGEKMDARYIAGSVGNASLMAFSRAAGGASLDHGVRILAVSPGPTETDRIVTLFRARAEQEFGDPERWREYLASLPMGRFGTPEEVANVAVFLASDRASYVSGIVVTVDGGGAARS